jgi:dTDP-4-dehydrorhamnose 3,5-epimerase
VPRTIPTALEGVLIVEPEVYRDNRGFFLETYHAEKYRACGLPATFVQDNHSSSVARTLRGLHLQRRRMPGKLVRVIRGAILDVAVDVRRGSPTFGRSVTVTLSGYIPPGFAHGFYVLSDSAEVEYKCTAAYDPAAEIGIVWNDPDLAIAWPDPAPVLSAKDAALPPLVEVMERLPLVGECQGTVALSAEAP